MTQFDLLQKDFNIKYHNQIKKICFPLQQYLHIDYISYRQVNDKGNYVFLANRPDYLEFYMENKLYQYDPYLIHPSYYRNQSYRFLISHNNIDRADQDTVGSIIALGRKLFNFSQTMMITIKQQGYIENFCFSANNEQPILNNFINHMELFYKFISYYKRNLSKEINDVTQVDINLNQLKGADFNKPYQAINIANSINYQTVLGHIAPHELAIYQKLQLLTSKEKQCLRLMIEGKTAYESGIIIGISKRTVEVHLASIRAKLGINTNMSNIAYLIGKYNLDNLI